MNEKDILDRQSRPQRFSTYIPKTRDWRYEMGVFRHDDFDDSRKECSVWDHMDYDCQTTSNEMGSQRGPSMGRTEFQSDHVASQVTVKSRTPNNKTLDAANESPIEIHKVRIARKAKPMRTNEPKTGAKSKIVILKVKKSALSNYKATGLIARLRFTSLNIVKMQQILDTALSQVLSSQVFSKTLLLHNSQSSITTDTPETSPTTTTSTSDSPDFDDSKKQFPLSQDTWIDETKDFNMKDICSTLQKSRGNIEDLGTKHHWYADAVRSDAIFPPGVPLSAKEIIAFYPHHVQREDVLLRLKKSGYRDADILGMQAFFRGPPTHDVPPGQRDCYQPEMIEAKTLGMEAVGYLKERGMTLHADDLTPDNRSVKARNTLPSFDDLLRGLNHLPSGSDARSLTQCLTWYLYTRDSFTPRLDLNVLHAQALTRALRRPLTPISPRKLDRDTLEEWRSKGHFDELKVWSQQRPPCAAQLATKKLLQRSQMRLNLDDEGFASEFPLEIRYILMFPFTKLHNFVRDALDMGIDKAKKRRQERIRKPSPPTSQDDERDASQVFKKQKLSPSNIPLETHGAVWPVVVHPDVLGGNEAQPTYEFSSRNVRPRGTHGTVYGRR